MKPNTEYLKKLSDEIRQSAFQTILTAKSGHLGACSSSTELMTALYFGNALRYSPSNPNDPLRDRVYVRGHVGPLRYKIFSMLGWIDEAELGTYRKLGSRLKGHESMHHTPGVDMTPSGSLGMLLSYATGSAIITNDHRMDVRHYVFLGDGEEQEGNVSEAARHIGSLRLKNIAAIIDKNEKQLSRPTGDVDSGTDLKKMWEGYGWRVVDLKEGHDLEKILEALREIEWEHPTLIIARTEKGKGLEGAVEHFNGYHTISSVSNIEILKNAANQATTANRVPLDEILTSISIGTRVGYNLPLIENKPYQVNIGVSPSNNKNLDSSQIDYLKGLKKIVEEQGLPFYFLTPDFLNDNVVSMLKLKEFAHYHDAGIREQHLVSMAHGISQTNPNARIWLNFGDAFVYRCSDQLNAAAQGKSRLVFMSEYSGITQANNGESHQTSGQPAVPLFMPGVDFYEPADVQDLFNVLNHTLSKNPGVVFVRSHRANVNPLPVANSERNIGSYVAFESDKAPSITLVGSGLTVGNLVDAGKSLEIRNHIGTRVINAINLNALDNSFTQKVIDGAPLLTAYNGNAEILGAITSNALLKFEGPRPSKVHSHGFQFGETGDLDQLIKHFGFDSESTQERILTILEKR
jgi:transketolase